MQAKIFPYSNADDASSSMRAQRETIKTPEINGRDGNDRHRRYIVLLVIGLSFNHGVIPVIKTTGRRIKIHDTVVATG